MIKDLYNEFVNVERLVVILNDEDEPTNKKEFETHIENLNCHIQTLDEKISKDITEGFGKDLKLFCDVQDIIEGDKIIRNTQTTKDEYRIVGLKNFNNYGDNSHMEIIIRAFES